MFFIKIKDYMQYMLKIGIPSFCNKNRVWKKLFFRIYGKQAILVKQAILSCKKDLKKCFSLEKPFLAHFDGILA
jgi:hypothetical protein